MLKASAPESAQFVVERRGKIEDVLGVVRCKAAAERVCEGRDDTCVGGGYQTAERRVPPVRG